MAMFYMKCIVAALSVAAISAQWKSLHVKYALWDGFYDIPLTVKDASSKYVFVEHDEDLNVDLYSYSDDPRFFILFDTYGNIAGLRTGYIKEDVAHRATSNNKTFLYDYDQNPFYQSEVYWNTSVWYTSVLFVNPETIKTGGRPDPRGVVAVDIYLPLEGNWTLIPKDQCQAEDLGFTKQACFIGMGMHYFHNVKNTSDCTDMTGVFTLYESGQLIGLGLTPFGSFTHKDRVWFEDPPVSTIKEIVPNRPDCLLDWASNFGTTSIHIFFKRFPRLTFCIWPWQKSDQCSK